MDGHYVNGSFNFSSGHGPATAIPQPHQRQPVQYPQAAYQTSHQASSYNFPSLAPLQPQRPTGSYAHGPYDPSVSQVPQRSLLTSHQLPSSQTSQPPSYSHFPASSSIYASSQQNHNYPLGSNYGQQQPFQAPQHGNASMPELSRLPSLQPYQITGINQSTTTSNGQPLRPLSMSIPTLEQTGNTRPPHVVGSQGRRGILPSAEGRPSAISNVEAGPPNQIVVNNKNASIPAKDLDGKFPCPHCPKTYLHAKHLKRHLLRHTGDRPYMCILCHDKFSRSDILKRHFQKCSIRRGNPTGATHLSHAQAHVKKQPNGGRKPSDLDMDDLPPPPAPQHILSNNDGSHGAFATTVISTSAFERQQSMSTPVTRRNSLNRSGLSIATKDRRSMTGPYPNAFVRGNPTVPPDNYSPASFSNSTVSTPLESSHHRLSGQYSHTATPGDVDHNSHLGMNGLNSSGHSMRDFQVTDSSHQSLGWLASSYAQHMDGYSVNLSSAASSAMPSPSKISRTDTQRNFSNRSDRQQPDYSEFFDEPASIPPNFPREYPQRPHDKSDVGSYETKAHHLINTCFPSHLFSPDVDVVLKMCLSADNIRHFLSLFRNYQSHWPVLHVPTFDPLQVYDGLLLVIVSIGAVYSDRVDLNQVRRLMDVTRAAIGRTAHVIRLLQDPMSSLDVSEMSDQTYEEVLSMVLLQSVYTWHGDASQRQCARDDFPKFARFSRQSHMLQPIGIEHPSFSPLHQRSPVYEQVSQAQRFDWSWSTWLYQEKRTRLMYLLFLLDAALVIYFNCSPHYHPCEITLPLPADDAAWDASTSDECARALGLYGSVGQSANITGSLRTKQMEMDIAMNTILRPECNVQPRSTNAYSKFILVHGLHVMIKNMQNTIVMGSGMRIVKDYEAYSSLQGLPYSQDRFLFNGSSGGTSRAGSGQATPTDSSGPPTPANFQSQVGVITKALNKWKKAWDADNAIQYPSQVTTPASAGSTSTVPSTRHSSSLPTDISFEPVHKRVGFCRDGIHFYWLARLFLSNTRHMDWLAPPEKRFLQVMKSLKDVKGFVVNESRGKGEELGSLAEMSEAYGIEDLSVDMRLLFAPMAEYDSPELV